MKIVSVNTHIHTHTHTQQSLQKKKQEEVTVRKVHTFMTDLGGIKLSKQFFINEIERRCRNGMLKK